MPASAISECLPRTVNTGSKRFRETGREISERIDGYESRGLWLFGFGNTSWQTRKE
jgi:hypothetical protein